MYSSYVLSDLTRVKLLQQFNPKHERLIAHHITVEFGGEPELPKETNVDVVGYFNLDKGIEVLVCSVDGSVLRPDQGIFHITWSLNPKVYRPVDSNVALTKYRRLIKFLALPVRNIEVTPTVSH